MQQIKVKVMKNEEKILHIKGHLYVDKHAYFFGNCRRVRTNVFMFIYKKKMLCLTDVLVKLTEWVLIHSENEYIFYFSFGFSFIVIFFPLLF